MTDNTNEPQRLYTEEEVQQLLQQQNATQQPEKIYTEDDVLKLLQRLREEEQAIHASDKEDRSLPLDIIDYLEEITPNPRKFQAI
ncbi:hypothetical protein G6F46_007956 [Rhizopus delemar]|uniref:Uncharacterized protein n=2 Tax=Rhizopus TaxID=4842 RepID=A0A9P6Z0X5_9FUNG|nr:hypothetical protein G6F43_010060 [Rhizopus delemar]KAG1189371.1 hypothetical protein G6F36_003948 [Rhizopus arrhizus]KAG1455811.1 hypothetical protein G6F55_006856 [Rhizopus delemar]KAG1495336.1 hypothetical protein G6F54_007245 [Rhizopus delemar]KAG1510391.1 hypothetical protein G6F53_006719 [Rhizopus delemar]